MPHDIDNIIKNIERGMRNKSNIDKYVRQLRAAGQLDVLMECGARLNGRLYKNRMNLLSYYIIANNYGKVKELLDGGDAANRLVVDANGCSALAVALEVKKQISSFDSRIIDLLLEQEAEAQIGLPDNNGMNPIFFCIRDQDLLLLKKLLPFANKNALLARVHRDMQDATPLFAVVAKTREQQMAIEIIEELLKYFPKEQLLLNGGFNDLPIHVAIAQGKIDIVKVLLQHYAKEQLEAIDANGNGVLHIAVRFGHKEIVKLILEQSGGSLVCIKDFSKFKTNKEILQKEKIDSPLKKNSLLIPGNENETVGALPLQIALTNPEKISNYPYLEIVQALLSYNASGQVLAETPDGRNILTLAMQIPDESIASLILHEVNYHTNNSLLLKPNEKGMIPLHHVVANNYIGMAKELLKNKPIEQINTFSHNLLPIHLACMKGSLPMMRLILSYEPEQINKKNMQEECTPLHFSSILNLNNKLVTEFLLRNQANRLMRDKNGHLPVHLALFYRNMPVINELLAQEIEAQILAQNKEGNNIFHLAVMYGLYEEMLSILEKQPLISRQAINQKNENGCSSLHLACMYGRERFIELFIQNGAYINMPEKDGLLPFHILCKYGHASQVRKLAPLLNGFEAKDELGRSGLVLAVMYEQCKVVAELLTLGFNVNASLTIEGEEITLLKIAIDNFDLKMFKLLLKSGANSDKRLVGQGREYGYAELIHAIENEEVRLKFLSELNQYRKVRSSEAVGYASSSVGQAITALKSRAYFTQMGLSVDKIEEFEEERKIRQLELKNQNRTQNKTQFFKPTATQSREDTWLEGLIHTSDDRIIPLELSEGDIAFCFIDKELLESQGCDSEELEDILEKRLSAKRFKKLESDKGVYTDKIQFPSGENEVTYTNELKLNKVDRILLFPVPSDTPGACLYVGSRYAPGGLHEKSQVRSIMQSGASGKVIHINWQAEHVARAANEMTPD